MPESRREFVAGALSLGIAASQAAQSTGVPNRPNILLLFPDQWRFDWMSSNAKLPIRTPNLDNLAKRGTRFARAMVAAPVCAPSRACLASGMEYDRAHVPNNEVDYPVNRATLYKKLRDGGYHTMACGKMDLAKGSNWWGKDGKWRMNSWGFSDQINGAGKWDQLGGLALNNNVPGEPYLTFLESRGVLKAHLDDYQKRRKDNYGSTFPTPLPEDAYCDNWVTQNALDLLARRPAGAPWFLQVNWPGPHDPEDITRRMEQTVRGLKMPPPVGPNRYSDEVNVLIRQNYTAMCENIDRCIGEILGSLEKSGQLDNTLVIFSSDHGEMLGDHDRWGKSVPYQPSIGVPLVVAGPGVRGGSANDALTSSIDITATVLDYAGVAADKIDGMSLRPVLEGTKATHRRVFYSGLNGWRLAFDGRYKAITGFSAARGAGNDGLTKYDPETLSRPPMVFDLVEDPGETKDTAGSMPKAAKDLLAGLVSGTYPA
jgi:hypothetical protein